MGVGTAEKQVHFWETTHRGIRSDSALNRRDREGHEADSSKMLIRGTTRFGLQKVRLKVHILPDGNGSALTIKALADDVWGKGARKGLERFLNTLGVAT